MPANIRVTVEPSYLPDQSKPIDEVYGFGYTITIGNDGDEPAQLISRHWVITDEDGGVEQVKGLGVVGHQPFLKPGQHFRYASGARLRTPTGKMRGTFFFVTDEGEQFAVPIPEFALDATGAALKA
jgi:ApaG protein